MVAPTVGKDDGERIEGAGTPVSGVPTTSTQTKVGIGIAIGLGVIVIVVAVLKYGFKLF